MGVLVVGCFKIMELSDTQIEVLWHCAARIVARAVEASLRGETVQGSFYADMFIEEAEEKLLEPSG